MKPTHLILVQAAPEEILERRLADKSRYRDALSKDDTVEELGLARSFLTVSSTLTGAPMFLVSNGDGEADKVASSIAMMLRSAVS